MSLIVLIYVDDIIVTGFNFEVIQALIRSLQQKFAIKDLGRLHFFLGIEVKSASTGLHLSQSKYIHEILTHANMQHSNHYHLLWCQTRLFLGLEVIPLIIRIYTDLLLVH